MGSDIFGELGLCAPDQERYTKKTFRESVIALYSKENF